MLVGVAQEKCRGPRAGRCFLLSVAHTQVLSDPQQRLARRLSRPPRAAQAKRARCTLQPARTREGVQKQKLAFWGIGQMCVAKVAMPHSMSTRQTHIGSGCKGICCCRTVVHRKSLCGKSEAPGKSGPLSRTPSLPTTQQAMNLLPLLGAPVSGQAYSVPGLATPLATATW